MNVLKMKKIALLPNVITAFGLSCGLFVIFKMNMIGIGEVNEQILTKVTAILLLAALADLLDGALARVMKAESDFGGLFDSLADSISFGVAPSIVVLKSLSVLPGTQLSFLVTLAALVFSLCGVLRLVRFSITAAAAKNDTTMALEHKKHFTGLPIPAAAAAAISLNLFFYSDDFHTLFVISQLTKIWVLSAALILLGYCMISRWKFPSVKTLRIHVGSFRVVFFTVLIAVIIFYGILHYFSLVFMCLAWSYVLIGWSFAIFRLIAGKKSKTLEEFEPEEDDFEDDDFPDQTDR